jgi:hypothetical protein
VLAKVGLARKLVRKPGYARAHGQPFEVAWPRGHAALGGAFDSYSSV